MNTPHSQGTCVPPLTHIPVREVRCVPAHPGNHHQAHMQTVMETFWSQQTTVACKGRQKNVERTQMLYARNIHNLVRKPRYICSLCELAFSSLGVLCPSTHPYPCQKGAMCAKAPFKPISGNASDCDGKRLSEDSVCCPADNVIPCSANSTIFRCKANPPGKSMFSYIQRWDLIFVHGLVKFLPALA